MFNGFHVIVLVMSYCEMSQSANDAYFSIFSTKSDSKNDDPSFFDKSILFDKARAEIESKVAGGSKPFFDLFSRGSSPDDGSESDTGKQSFFNRKTLFDGKPLFGGKPFFGETPIFRSKIQSDDKSIFNRRPFVEGRSIFDAKSIFDSNQFIQSWTRDEENEVLPSRIEEIPIEEVVRSRGYPVDKYEVVTEDHYILTVHRIRHGNTSQETNQVPVFLQHGMLDCSSVWTSAPNGLAYFLANAGYDVWIGNSRGNIYSKKHEYMDATNKSFWDFSFHEMGVYDLPAVLGFVVEQTGVSRMHYVGMSMGTTQLLVLLTLRPELHLLLDTVVLLAPVARPSHMALIQPLKLQPKLGYFVLNTLNNIGTGELLGHSKKISFYMHLFCSQEGLTRAMCEKVSRSISAPEMDMFDFDNAVQNLRYYPGGSSVKTHLHYLQMAMTEKFQMFDYEEDNPAHYEGSPTPPLYDLGAIHKRLYLMYGGADQVAHPTDVRWMKERLPDAVFVSEEDFRYFTHRDFIHGVDLENIMYKKIDDLFHERFDQLNLT